MSSAVIVIGTLKVKSITIHLPEVVCREGGGGKGGQKRYDGREKNPYHTNCKHNRQALVPLLTN